VFAIDLLPVQIKEERVGHLVELLSYREKFFLALN
jgi:hypothetical protein